MSDAVGHGWAVVPLGFVADVQLGKMLSAKAKNGQGARPYLRNVNVRWHQIDVDDVFEMDFNAREAEKYELHAGDVLVCEGGEPGRAAIWYDQLPGALYQKALHRVRFRSGILDPKLFVYQLELAAATGGLTRRFTGSTIKHLPRESFIDYDVLVPPTAEQRRIVAALEEHLSDLDAAVAGLERARANIHRYRRSVLESKLSPRAAETREWPVYLLGALAQTSSGGTPSRARADYFGGSIPWLKSGELNDGIVRETEETITPAGLANSSAKVFSRGTLCIALYGATVGRLGILDIDASTNQAVCGITAGGRVETSWLFYVLLEGRQRLVDAGKGGAQSNISQGIVRAYQVPLPPPAEQRAVVAELEQQLASSDRTIADIDVQLARAARLRQAILQRAFSGRLVPQDPADEPAAALLARIRAERGARPTRASRRQATA